MVVTVAPSEQLVMVREALLQYRFLATGEPHHHFQTAARAWQKNSRTKTARGDQAPLLAEEFAKKARALLNKLCPEKDETIIRQVVALINKYPNHLGVAIDVIVKQVWDQSVYGECFADLVFVLSEVFSRSQGDDFRTLLLNSCQDRFGALCALFHNPETEDEIARNKHKKGTLATVRFLGMLHLRGLLGFKVIQSIAADLTDVSVDQSMDAELMVECALALLKSVGHTADMRQIGREMIAGTLARCEVVRQQSSCPKRLLFLVNDLQELRSNHWRLSPHESRPASIEEARRSSQNQLAGVRPAQQMAKLARLAAEVAQPGSR